MDEEHGAQLNLLRNFMFENVYRSQRVKKEEDAWGRFQHFHHPKALLIVSKTAWMHIVKI